MADPIDSISTAVAAIGALGLSSYALVDATKVGAMGGVSRSGFVYVESAVRQFLANEKLSAKQSNDAAATAPRTVLDILYANWISGVPLGDQRAVAKSLLKLRLTPATAEKFAGASGVSAEVLTKVAAKMTTGEDLLPAEANVLGRFDLALTAVLEEGYQRADQRYRNTTRVMAMVISLTIAVFAGWAIEDSTKTYWFGTLMWKAFFCGILATPLAPISKDLASALQAGVKMAQSLKK